MSSSDHEDDDKLFNLKSVKENELSKYEQCVTNAADSRKHAIWEDDEGRYYRPRRVLTEMENNKKTEKDVSERYIWLDVYLLPAPRTTKTLVTESETIQKSTKRVKRERPKRTEKAEPPNEGDIVTFHLRKDRLTDTVSVKEFQGVLERVNWGTLVVAGKTGGVVPKNEPNFGVVKVAVRGTYSRSLIVKPEFELKANLHDLPA